MGGNVANGSPIGDSPPVLMALDAQIELRRGERVRRMPLPEFYVDYMKNKLEPGEFVQGLAVPLAARRASVRAYKISKRFDCDISALCAGFAIALDGDMVKEVRLAFGGMAATVKRAAQAEAALRRQALDPGQRERRQAGAGAGLQAAVATCARAPPTGCRWRRICCSGCGWKRAPRAAAGGSHQRLERDAARRHAAVQGA